MSDHGRMDVCTLLNNDEEKHGLVRPVQGGVETKIRKPFFASNPYIRPALTFWPSPAPHPASKQLGPKLSLSSEGTYLEEYHWQCVMKGPTGTQLAPMKLDWPTYPIILPPLHHVLPRGAYHPSPPSDPAGESQPLSQPPGSSNDLGVGRNRPSHSNKEYNREQVHLMRYFKVDCDKHFDDIVEIWQGRWPGERELTNQCVSSRTYRDNIRPLYDEKGDWVVIDINRAIMVNCKIRERHLPENKHVPETLVGRHPDMVMEYSWTSQKHKDEAEALIAKDAAEPTTQGAIFRKLFKLWNDILLAKEKNKVGRRFRDHYSFVILVRSNTEEVETLCDCEALEKLRGHLVACRAWDHPTLKRCSCPWKIRLLTTHHLPECESHRAA